MEILQGTLGIMVLKTLLAMGPLHGYGVARRLEQTARSRSACGGSLRRSQTTQDVRDAWTWPSAERAWQSVRQSLRALRRAPMFTAASVLTLAIGIGATTTVFSVVNVSLLKPLPYPKADRLVALGVGVQTAFTGAEVHAVGEHLRSVESFAWYGGRRIWNFETTGQPVSVTGGHVSRRLLAALGVAPRLGRWFTDSDDVPNAPPVHSCARVSSCSWRACAPDSPAPWSSSAPCAHRYGASPPST